jgi:(2Fe-2S) ferredoxin
MPKPEKHVFVCTQARPAGHPRGSCAEKGCAEVMTEFMNEMERRQLFNRVALTNTGCLGSCHIGPSVLVYPEGVMYGGVRKSDVARIFDEHLLGDAPVAELMAPADVWG